MDYIMATPSRLQGQQQTIDEIVHQHLPLEGPLLPILHAIQSKFGYVPKESVPQIAEPLKLTRAEVHGVISFYHFFRSSPPGHHTVQVCRAEACQAMGARQLESDIKQRLNIDYHQTSAVGEITLEPVYCLGNCACAPSIRVGEQIYGRVDIHRFDDIVEELTTTAVKIML